MKFRNHSLIILGISVVSLILINVGCGKKSNRSGAFAPAGSLPTSFSKGSPTVPDVVLQNGDFSLILPDADAARHFNIKVEQVENGKTRVTVGVRDLEQVSMLAFDVGFDPARYSPGSVKDLGFMGGEEKTLFLALTDVKGRVPVGIVRIRPQDNGFVSGSGDLFVVEFDDAPQGQARTIGKPRTDVYTIPLIETADGFIWEEEREGDWDNDGMVSASDILPIALHFGASDYIFDPDYWVYAVYLDADQSGFLNAADIAAIAFHFGESTAGYNLYEATDFTGADARLISSVPRPTPPPDPDNPPWYWSLAPVQYDIRNAVPPVSPQIGLFYRVVPFDRDGVESDIMSNWTQWTGGGGPTVFSHLYELGVNITVDNSPEIPVNPMEFDGDAWVTDPAISGAFAGLPDLEYATDTAQTDFNARVYVSLASVMVQPMDADGNFIDSDPLTPGIQPYAPQLLDAANPSWDPTGTGQLILWTHYTDNNFAVTVDPVYFDSTGAGSSITLTPTQVFTPAQTVTITTHDVVPISNPSPPEKTITADFISIGAPSVVPRILQLRPNGDVQLPVPLLLLQIIGEKLDQDTTPPSVGVFAVELVEDTGVLSPITKDTTPNKVTFQSVTAYTDPLFPTADSLIQAEGVFITNDILFPDPNNPGEYLPTSYHSILTNGFGRITPVNSSPDNTITFLPIIPPPPATDPKPAPTTFVEAASDRGTGSPLLLTPGLYTDLQGIKQVGTIDVWYHYENYQPLGQNNPPWPQRLRVISPRVRLKDPSSGFVLEFWSGASNLPDFGPDPEQDGPFGDYTAFANPRYNNFPIAGSVLWHNPTIENDPPGTRKAYKVSSQPWVIFSNFERFYWDTWVTGPPPIPSKQFTLEILTWPDSQIDPNSGNTIGPPTIKTQDIVLYNQHSGGQPSVKIDSLKNETQGPGWDVNQGQVVTDDVLVLEGSGFWWGFNQLTSDQDPIEWNWVEPIVWLFDPNDLNTPVGRLYYEYAPNFRLTRANTQLIKVKVPVDPADMPMGIDFVIGIKNPDLSLDSRDYDIRYYPKQIIRTG